MLYGNVADAGDHLVDWFQFVSHQRKGIFSVSSAAADTKQYSRAELVTSVLCLQMKSLAADLNILSVYQSNSESFSFKVFSWRKAEILSHNT